MKAKFGKPSEASDSAAPKFGKPNAGGGSNEQLADPGKLGPIAPKILMQLLYHARWARPDLLRAINHLACFVTKWTTKEDLKNA